MARQLNANSSSCDSFLEGVRGMGADSALSNCSAGLSPREAKSHESHADEIGRILSLGEDTAEIAQRDDASPRLSQE